MPAQVISHLKSVTSQNFVSIHSEKSKFVTKYGLASHFEASMYSYVTEDKELGHSSRFTFKYFGLNETLLCLS